MDNLKSVIQCFRGLARGVGSICGKSCRKKGKKMSDSDDCYSYQEYGLDWYEEQEGPPLIKKKSRLIAAVVQNQVELLRELLDSPKWYAVCDKWGYSLLQISILCDNVEVFDYLLSIPDFPLDFVNKFNQTAFTTSIEGFVNNDIWMKEHFACELIKKEADGTREHLGIPLHHALERTYFKAATLLIRKGADVNCIDNGLTPLDQALKNRGDVEVVMALLVSGAEPTISAFEDSIIYDLHEEIQEVLFLLLFDKYSHFQMNWYAAVTLAEKNPQLFDKVLKYSIKIVFSPDNMATFILTCCSMKTDALRLILTKLRPSLNETIASLANPRDPFIAAADLDNLDVLLQSDLRDMVLSFIANLDTNESFRYLYHRHAESDVFATCCYLLSYSLSLRESDLNMVYYKFGYGEFFKILLQMDVILEVPENGFPEWGWPVYIYDIGMRRKGIVANPGSLRELLDYFRDPQLVKLYNDMNPEKEHIEVQVPLLVELARNTFRTFFIDSFNITSSRMFHTLVKKLDINMVYKDIITYEKKLY